MNKKHVFILYTVSLNTEVHTLKNCASSFLHSENIDVHKNTKKKIMCKYNFVKQAVPALCATYTNQDG